MPKNDLKNQAWKFALIQPKCYIFNEGIESGNRGAQMNELNRYIIFSNKTLQIILNNIITPRRSCCVTFDRTRKILNHSTLCMYKYKQFKLIHLGLW